MVVWEYLSIFKLLFVIRRYFVIIAYIHTKYCFINLVKKYLPGIVVLDAGGLPVVLLPPGPGGTYVVELTFDGVAGAVVLPDGGVPAVPLPPGGTNVVELTFGGVGGAVVFPDGGGVPFVPLPPGDTNKY